MLALLVQQLHELVVLRKQELLPVVVDVDVFNKPGQVRVKLGVPCVLRLVGQQPRAYAQLLIYELLVLVDCLQELGNQPLVFADVLR